MGKKRKQFDGNNAEFGINERSNYESQQKKIMHYIESNVVEHQS